MSLERDFKSRYADVLDVTLRNALSETKTLYESLVEELQAEMCLVKKENEALRSKYNRLKKRGRVDTASQCDFLHQVPEDQAHLERPGKPAALKCKDDEDRDMARLNCRASQPTSDDQLLSSHSSKTDGVDSDDSEDSRTSVDSDESEDSQSSVEDLNTLKPQNKRSTELEASKRTPFKRGPRVCTICRKRCHNALGLKVHMKIHVLEKAYVCTDCGKGWYLKGHLTQHMKHKHTGSNPQLADTPFSCTICQTSFKESAHLKTHMNSHTFVKGLICTVCGKKCKYKSGLKRHMRIHTEEKPSCTVCGKKCKYKSVLKRHMRIHTEEKPFSCTVCGKKCKYKSVLKRHMRIHTEEKPFSCTVCGKKCKYKSVLNRHMRIHTEEKPFSCTVCGKGFSQSTRLTTHMRMHTGAKPYVCTVCDRSFCNSESLSSHMLVHTCFSCIICRKRFDQSSELKEHMVIHTSTPPKPHVDHSYAMAFPSG